MGLIEGQDLVGFIDGESVALDRLIKVPVAKDSSETKEEDNPTYLAWRRSDRLLCG